MKGIKTKFKGVYVVQNYGSFRHLFHQYTDAIRFVYEKGTHNGVEIYQIYKCDVELKNIVPKNDTAKEVLKSKK